MEQIFESVKEIEQAVSLYLSDNPDTAESLMIENAALALKKSVLKICSSKKNRVTVLCGCGNNGADGYTLSRMLCGICKVNVIQISAPKSKFCISSFNNLKKLFDDSTCNLNIYNLSELKENILIENAVKKSDVIVDCIFGTGFHGNVSSEIKDLFSLVNQTKAKRIACDVPSGLDGTGENVSLMSFEEKKKNIFKASTTVTMGGYKISLFSDAAKDFTGKIKKAEIGVSDEIFDAFGGRIFNSDKIFLLKKKDLHLPVREEENSHKGKFGHVCVIAGEKGGAGILSASAALKSGCGLSTILLKNVQSIEGFKIPPSVMVSEKVPENASCFVIGPGLGRDKSIAEAVQLVKDKNAAVVFDADSFYYDDTVAFLISSTASENRIILTPHPKEFSVLLKASLGIDVTVSEIAFRRLELVRKFCSEFKNAVLVLKGANTMIGFGDTVYISTYGTNALSKAGSGDVLSGVAASLLAQNYSAIDAACSAVLMHGIASRKFEKNYNLTPELLIENL